MLAEIVLIAHGVEQIFGEFRLARKKTERVSASLRLAKNDFLSRLSSCTYRFRRLGQYQPQSGLRRNDNYLYSSSALFLRRKDCRQERVAQHD